MRTRLIAAAASIAALAVAGCGDGDEGDDVSTSQDLPRGAERVELDPAEFTTEIDNPYWPMKPGNRWVYRETEGGSELRVVVTVTDRTKKVANGIEARVVHDVVSEKGEAIEITDDWYAQDSDGNIWYLGEDTAEYENGEVVTRSGSFEAGVDGAQPGIAMPGDPRPGSTYRQEYLAGEAEDFAKVLSTDAKVSVPYGRFAGALKT
ncbi:MAG TPA: hypothetical protein VK920_01575, partial [Solirubrobacterales bacterium]|nr:hypothetical protein [Solirubrobacterales bacterium]